jgi:hypothetical protein
MLDTARGSSRRPQRPPPGLGDPHTRDLQRLLTSAHALFRRRGQPFADELDHQLDAEPMRDQQRLGAAARARGKQRERALALTLATRHATGHQPQPRRNSRRLIRSPRRRGRCWRHLSGMCSRKASGRSLQLAYCALASVEPGVTLFETPDEHVEVITKLIRLVEDDLSTIRNVMRRDGVIGNRD